MSLRHRALGGATAAIITGALGVSGVMADPAAVSGLNLEVGGNATFLEDTEVYGGNASVAFPLAEQFGLQADGYVGDLEEEVVWGIGGQIFWRSASQGSLGLNVAHLELGDFVSLQNYSLDAEMYADALTFSGGVGYIDNDLADGSGVGTLGLKLYLTDSFTIAATGSGLFGGDVEGGVFTADAELGFYDFRPGLSIFGAATTETDAEEFTLSAGLKMQLGGKAQTLKQRDRQDRRDNQFTGSAGILQKSTAVISRVAGAQAAGIPAGCNILQDDLDALLLCPLAAALAP